MKTPKSPRSDARYRQVGALLLLWLATACGDQQDSSDTGGTGGGSGTHAGGTTGAPGGGPASGGATSGAAGVGVAGHVAVGSGGTGGGAAGGAQGGGRSGGAGGAAGRSGGGAGAAAGQSGSGGAATGGAGGSAAGAAGTATGGRASGGAGGSPSGGANQGGAPGATLAAVQAIFDDRCVNCHDASKGGLPTYPMLPLTAGASHAALVNVAADETCGGVRVVPGDPDASYLVKKLEQTTPCDGSHMPRAFEVGTAPPLTADQLATIRAWIAAGAPN